MRERLSLHLTQQESINFLLVGTEPIGYCLPLVGVVEAVVEGLLLL
jgi:hypothetical protein